MEAGGSKKAKDRLLGMVLILGSAILHLTSSGFSVSIGTLYSSLHNYFHISNSKASWLVSVYTGLLLGAGLPSGICVKLFGDRVVAIVGCLLLVTGLVSSAFVNTFWPLYVTFGVLGGIGSSLSHVAANTILVKYFDQRRALAIALASCGVGIGNLVLPPLMIYCIGEFGWRGTFIMLAAVAMQGIVAGATFREPQKSEQEVPGDTDQTSADEMSQDTRQNLIMFAKDRRFILFLISSTLTSCAVYVPYTMLPDLLKSQSLAENEIAVVASISGCGDIFGRIAVGVVSGVWAINKLYLHILVVISAGLMAILAPFIETFAIFIIYSIIYGISTGGFTGLQVVIVSEIVGKEKTALGYGAMATCKGIASCIGIPLAGFIIDSSHGYQEAFFFAGGNLLVAGIIAASIKMNCRQSWGCLPHSSSQDLNQENIEKAK